MIKKLIDFIVDNKALLVIILVLSVALTLTLLVLADKNGQMCFEPIQIETQTLTI